MNFLDFKNLLFEKAKIAGFNECEIYFSDGESISISVSENSADFVSQHTDRNTSMKTHQLIINLLKFLSKEIPQIQI